MLRLAKKAPRVFLFFLPEQVADCVIFEARAFVSRLFARPLDLEPRAGNFLDLGSGPPGRTGGCGEMTTEQGVA